MATVKISADREIAADLSTFQRVGADWALLGRLFRGPVDQETVAMKEEIQERLNHPAESQATPR
jgi:hypothetical protein